MNINWKTGNTSGGRLIHTNGSVSGSGDNIVIQIPKNIEIVMSVRPDYSPTITSAQVNTLRGILKGLGDGVKFSSSSPNLEELAISIYHGNRS